MLAHWPGFWHCTVTLPLCGTGAVGEMCMVLLCGAVVVVAGERVTSERLCVLQRSVGQGTAVPPTLHVAVAGADSPWKNMSLCPFSNAQVRLAWETTLKGALQENEVAAAITDFPLCGAEAEARIERFVWGLAAAGVFVGLTPPPFAVCDQENAGQLTSWPRLL